MGGGVGVSLHGSHRVAGERYQFAMPEVGIGFFPTSARPTPCRASPARPAPLSRSPASGSARPMRSLSVLRPTRFDRPCQPSCARRSTAGEPVEETLARLSHDPGPTPLAAERETIDRCFAGESVTAILASLDSDASDFGRKTAATIRAKSPTSLVVALEQMCRGRDLSFENAMRTEFRIVSRIIEGHDFYEGVRAAIIDKDGAPRWRPASLEEVDAPAAIARSFAELGRAELELP